MAEKQLNMKVKHEIQSNVKEQNEQAGELKNTVKEVEKSLKETSGKKLVDVSQKDISDLREFSRELDDIKRKMVDLQSLGVGKLTKTEAGELKRLTKRQEMMHGMGLELSPLNLLKMEGLQGRKERADEFRRVNQRHTEITSVIKNLKHLMPDESSIPIGGMFGAFGQQMGMGGMSGLMRMAGPAAIAAGVGMLAHSAISNVSQGMHRAGQFSRMVLPLQAYGMGDWYNIAGRRDDYLGRLGLGGPDRAAALMQLGRVMGSDAQSRLTDVVSFGLLSGMEPGQAAGMVANLQEMYGGDITGLMQTLRGTTGLQTNFRGRTGYATQQMMGLMGAYRQRTGGMITPEATENLLGLYAGAVEQHGFRGMVDAPGYIQQFQQAGFSAQGRVEQFMMRAFLKHTSGPKDLRAFKLWRESGAFMDAVWKEANASYGADADVALSEMGFGSMTNLMRFGNVPMGETRRAGLGVDPGGFLGAYNQLQLREEYEEYDIGAQFGAAGVQFTELAKSISTRALMAAAARDKLEKQAPLPAEAIQRIQEEGGMQNMSRKKLLGILQEPDVAAKLTQRQRDITTDKTFDPGSSAAMSPWGGIGEGAEQMSLMDFFMGTQLNIGGEVKISVDPGLSADVVNSKNVNLSTRENVGSP